MDGHCEELLDRTKKTPTGTVEETESTNTLSYFDAGVVGEPPLQTEIKYAERTRLFHGSVEKPKKTFNKFNTERAY